MKSLIDREPVRVVKEPHPIAVYVRNIGKTPIRDIRNALRQSLPSWALLRPSFIGGSLLEIIVHVRQNPRLVVKLPVIGV